MLSLSFHSVCNNKQFPKAEAGAQSLTPTIQQYIYLQVVSPLKKMNRTNHSYFRSLHTATQNPVGLHTIPAVG